MSIVADLVIEQRPPIVLDLTGDADDITGDLLLDVPDSIRLDLGGVAGAQGPEGPEGPEGPSGVAFATAPLHYDGPTQTISIDTSSIETEIAGKVAKTGDTMSGDLGMGGHKVTGAGDATTATGLTTLQQVSGLINALVNSAPGTLDTLKELADALGDDPNFAATVTTALAGKMAIAANGSDVNNPATFRTNLGLKTGAVNDKVAAGATGVLDATDPSTTNARTPTAHAATHNHGGADLITPASSDVTISTAGLVIVTHTNVQAAVADLDAYLVKATPITRHRTEAFGWLPSASSATQGLLSGGVYYLSMATYGNDATAPTAPGSTSSWELVGHWSGTYTLNIFYAKLPNTGIVKHEISKDGGATWSTLATGIDTYTATVGGANAISQYTGIAIPEGSTVWFRITVTGKNASASQYFYVISGWELLRTGP